MQYNLKIRQSYHGTGGKDGYVFEVYDRDDFLIGELFDIPTKANIGNTIELHNQLYIITKLYDSKLPEDEEDEVIFYELTEYEYKPDYKLEYKYRGQYEI